MLNYICNNKFTTSCQESIINWEERRKNVERMTFIPDAKPMEAVIFQADS